MTFDLGTSHLKVALFALGDAALRDGTLIDQRSRRHREFGAGERRWQDADHWWRDAVTLARELLAQHPARIAGISLSGRGGAAVFVAGDGRVVAHPWLDGRHQGELQALLAEAAPTAVAAQQLPTYAAQLISKWRWLERHEPRVANTVAHALYGKDLLLYRLTNTAITDPSSGPGALQWPTAARAAISRPDLLPTAMLPWQIAAPLAPKAARALGLPAGTPVCVGAHDGICANVGAAAAAPGAAALTLGTHAVMRAVVTDAPAAANYFYHLPPNRHVIGVNAWFAGRAPDWFLDIIFGTQDGDRPAHFRQLEAAAATANPGADGARFMPYLAGSVAPERRPEARASWHGLSITHSRAEMYRAVLEGCTFAIADAVEQLDKWRVPPTIANARSATAVTGGGAHSPLWCQMLADVLRRPLVVSDAAVEGRGATILAAVGLGRYDNYDVAGQTMFTPSQRYEPGPDATLYAQHFAAWRDIAAHRP